ncbi:MAG TPA: gamma-glutamyltransferase family protein [Caldimonas sp.]|jgi:gamma-glutamyltranspeptidase/glutathione hydrolase|nr:gamma-glutamyltransferase family protein [Caldimonas sp.]HEX2539707.1 gamma-glutamyltransferase family protein [Caldimonas sp.]
MLPNLMSAVRRCSGHSSSLRNAVLSLAITAAAAGATAQSQTPFGIPLGLENPGVSLNDKTVRGTRPMGWRDQGRSEVVARNGMVATSHHLAAQAGLEILEKGGNAMDAAVATAAVLDVTSQNDTGIGGDVFVLYWSARDKKLYALNSAGWAPAGWTESYFSTRTLTGVNSITVPGAVAGFDAMLKRFGTMTFRETFDRAATLAEEGFGITERHHADWASSVNALRNDIDSARELLVNNNVPALYSVFRNPGLARAMRLLQTQGADAFYRGPIAEAIVNKVQSLGGVMTLSDLADFRPEWVEPISTNYHGFDVFQVPPPGQGWAALLMLNILEACVPHHGYNLANLGHMSPQFWHFLVEAKKLAYADLGAYNGDPLFVKVPLIRLLSKSYAASKCNQLNPMRASVVPGPNPLGGTINLMTADRWGNMASVVHSVFNVFGSRITVPGYGFVLHDRGAGFNRTPNHPNVVAPRKRPFHTIITGFVMKDGEPRMAFGNMQGAIQAYSHVTHLINAIDLGFNPQASADAARYTHSQSTTGPGTLSLEPNLRSIVGDALQAMGHPIATTNGSVGGFQAIYFQRDPALPAPQFNSPRPGPVNGVYRSGSDPRKDGHAVGW